MKYISTYNLKLGLKSFYRSFMLLITLLSIFVLVLPAPAKATTMEDCLKVMNEEDCKSIFNDWVWYKQDLAENCVDTNSQNNFVNTNVYVLGDSLLEGTKDGIEQSLKANGFTDFGIDASQGRSIGNAGTTGTNTSGLEAIKNDDDLIRNANTIIIELGTNSEADFKSKQEELLNEMQGLNSSAKYYWVNVAKKVATDLDNSTNQTIQDNSVPFEYTVIDWKSNAKQDYFADDSAHPWSNGGKEAYIKTIVDAVGSPQSAATPSTTSSPAQQGFLQTDTSKKAGERVWSFIVSPQGLNLNPNQAAGVMGNLLQESGFDPEKLEGGGTEPGRGIVQWTTGSRKAKLDAFTEKNKSNFKDALDLQLNFMKVELINDFPNTYSFLQSSLDSTFKDNLNISDPVVAAALIFHGNGSGNNPNLVKQGYPAKKVVVPGLKGPSYEGSADPYSFVIDIRGVKYGHQALKDYGGIDASTNTSWTTSSALCSNNLSGTGGPGPGGWELKDMTLYNQGGKDYWTRKTYSDCGTFGKCGCPVITAATIISTLTTTKIDPFQLFKENPSGGWETSVIGRYGLDKSTLDVNASGFAKLAEILKSGGLGAIHVKKKGEFTSSGEHYFVIRKFENDKFYVYTLFDDSRNEKAYSVEDFINNGAVELWGYVNPNGPPRSSSSNVLDWGPEIEKIISNAKISATYAPKWKDQSIAGNGTWTPKYVILHHTAGTNSSDIIEEGHPGYPGIPRANFLVNKDGSIKVFSKWMTYHAGKGNGINEVPDDGMNDYSFGIEVESLGTQKDFTDAQTNTVVKLTAGLLKSMGVGAENVMNHKTWSNTGKTDTLYSDDYWRSLIKKELPSTINKSSGTTSSSTSAKLSEYTNDQAKNLTVVVNKKHSVSSSYTPPGLTTFSTKYSFSGADQLREEAKQPLQNMLDALKDNCKEESCQNTKIQSAYRSYDKQKTNYDNKVASVGRAETDKVMARPGYSEHQLGLAADIANTDGTLRSDEISKTDSAKWLANNSYKYGFILRYPEGKESTTGYSYEPWHFRYVGKTEAKKIFDSGKTMDEYYGVTSGDSYE